MPTNFGVDLGIFDYFRKEILIYVFSIVLPAWHLEREVMAFL